MLLVSHVCCPNMQLAIKYSLVFKRNKYLRHGFKCFINSFYCPLRTLFSISANTVLNVFDFLVPRDSWKSVIRNVLFLNG